MGVFEKPPFDRGTVALAKAVADSGAISMVGGGDSEKAIKSAGVAGKISHISTGGGASLEFLAGIGLPGVAALDTENSPAQERLAQTRVVTRNTQKNIRSGRHSPGLRPTPSSAWRS